MRKAHNVEVKLVDNNFLYANRDELANIIRKAFEKSTFVHKGPSMNHIISLLPEEMSEGRGDYGHFVAMKNGKIIGAVLKAPLVRREDIKSTSLGWCFVSPEMGLWERVRVANRILDATHEHLANLGFDRVETFIGTAEGERFAKSHKYKPVTKKPTKGHPKRWFKDLTSHRKL